MLNRKETAWKKNRKFGDIKGGRLRTKLADNIFKREHNLTPPTEGQDTPIFLIDNPSKNFFFPITEADVKAILEQMPPDHVSGITHIWLRKFDTTEKKEVERIQGEFICGSGVSLIVLYPFPVDLKMRFVNKPTRKELKAYAKYSDDLRRDNKGWYLVWTESKLKEYVLTSLLLHEIGHHIESYYKRYWSPAYRKRAENFADNYAVTWGNRIKSISE